MPTNPRLLACLALLGVLAPASASAQVPVFAPLPRLASEADELLRLERLTGTDSLRPQTLRSPSRLMAWDAASRFGAPLAPELMVSSNSALAEGGNDGALWQGRGRNAMVTAGFVGQHGPVRVILAPQLVASQNLEYQVIPYQQDGLPPRSVWANPFHPAPEGLDLPLRHGDRPIVRLTPGQSSISVRGRGLEGGVSTENAWWGPGLRNAILLSANAAGVPSVFLRASRPHATRAGTWDAWLSVGMLAESDHFDDDAANDARTLSALAVTWRPPGSRAIELGAGRIVITSGSPALASIVAPLRSVGRPNGPDSLDAGDDDQVTSLWARIAPPGAGFEAWAEWARFEEPASLRDLLESPGHSQGYTLGLQWLRPVAAARLRFWAEATYLEPSASVRLRPVGASYVSRAVDQGFTNDGQSLGAAIGPAGSSQGVGTDFMQGTWRVGVYGMRIRWDNAALFTSTVPDTKREDVSLTGGLRAAGQWGPVRVTADWAHTARINYLYQAYLLDELTGRSEGVDIANNSVSVTISTPLR